MKSTWILLPVCFFEECGKEGSGSSSKWYAIFFFCTCANIRLLNGDSEAEDLSPNSLTPQLSDEKHSNQLLSWQPSWTHIKHLTFAGTAAIKNKIKAGNSMDKRWCRKIRKPRGLLVRMKCGTTTVGNTMKVHHGPKLKLTYNPVNWYRKQNGVCQQFRGRNYRA